MENTNTKTKVKEDKPKCRVCNIKLEKKWYKICTPCYIKETYGEIKKGVWLI